MNHFNSTMIILSLAKVLSVQKTRLVKVNSLPFPLEYSSHKLWKPQGAAVEFQT